MEIETDRLEVRLFLIPVRKTRHDDGKMMVSCKTHYGDNISKCFANRGARTPQSSALRRCIAKCTAHMSRDLYGVVY